MSQPRPIVFGVQREGLLPAFHAVSSLRPCVLVRKPADLSAELLQAVKPEWVVLPDWSWIIPAELLTLAPFVGFHAADLPDYRGGSPLQHQIIDGVRTTKLSLFRIGAGLDTGDIFGQEALSLDGTIGTVWARITALVPTMVARLLAGDYQPRPQRAGGFVRKRRRPEDSEIAEVTLTLAQWYDRLRALDDPYPNAFVRYAGKRIAFRAPRWQDGRIIAEAVIEEDAHE